MFGGRLVFVCRRIFFCRRGRAGEPDFAPVGIDGAWADAAEAAGAVDVFEDDGSAARLQHAAGGFFEDALDAAEDAKALAAVGEHFAVEDETAIAAAFVERGDDFLTAFDDDPFAGLEIQFFGGSLLEGACHIGITAAEEAAREFVERGAEKAANDRQQRFAIDEDVAEILAGLPPGERTAGFFQLGGLAAVADFWIGGLALDGVECEPGGVARSLG